MPTGQEVAGGWTNLHNEQLLDLCDSSHVEVME
jgi:hypothetical protein